MVKKNIVFPILFIFLSLNIFSNNHEVLARKLKEAIKWGSLKQINDLISEGAPLDYMDSHSTERAVCLAINAKRPRAFWLLVISGARTHLPYGKRLCKLDIDPIHYAALISNESLVERIIKKGAKINSKASFDKTALHLIAAEGTPQMVDFLVKKGASLREKDDKDQTPLYDALENNNLRVLSRLLLLGSNVNINRKYRKNIFLVENRSPLFLAAEKRKPRHLNLMILLAKFVHKQNLRQAIRKYKALEALDVRLLKSSKVIKRPGPLASDSL